jgi:trigger factor
MNIKVKAVDKCRKELEVEIDKEAVAQEFEKVFSDIQKHANIKGFRKGKAPIGIVKQHYAKVAEEEVIKSLISDAYRKALEQEKLQPASLPSIADVKLSEGKLFFKATVDLRP